MTKQFKPKLPRHLWYDRQGNILDNGEFGSAQRHEAMKVIDRLLQNREYKQVVFDVLPNGKRVSTVWLGVNYNFHLTGKPIIIETMVFDKPDRLRRFKFWLPKWKRHWGSLEELDMARYTSEKQALTGHKRMVKKWS